MSDSSKERRATVRKTANKKYEVEFLNNMSGTHVSPLPLQNALPANSAKPANNSANSAKPANNSANSAKPANNSANSAISAKPANNSANSANSAKPANNSSRRTQRRLEELEELNKVFKSLPRSKPKIIRKNFGRETPKKGGKQRNNRTQRNHK